jgi:hypothetical protein
MLPMGQADEIAELAQTMGPVGIAKHLGWT